MIRTLREDIINKPVQAVILAGGLGTRIRQIVSDRPKSLADINGKPFLHYQIKFLRNNGIKDIVMCIGYMGQKVQEYFSDGKNFEIYIQYSSETDSLLGTGGALKKARNLLEKRFFVVNGDTLFLTNLKDMQCFHEQSLSCLTMALTRVENQSRYGSVKLEHTNQSSSRIINFREKSHLPSLLVNAGVYLFEKSSVRWNDLGDVFSLEYELLPKILQMPHHRVYGFVDENAYFVDIGTPEGYKKLESDFGPNGKYQNF